MTVEALNIHPANIRPIQNTLKTMKDWLEITKAATWKTELPIHSICNCGVIHPERKYVPTRYTVAELAKQPTAHSELCRALAQMEENRFRRECMQAPGALIEAGTLAYHYLLQFLQTPQPQERAAAAEVLERAIAETHKARALVMFCDAPAVTQHLRDLDRALTKIKRMQAAKQINL